MCVKKLAFERGHYGDSRLYSFACGYSIYFQQNRASTQVQYGPTLRSGCRPMVGKVSYSAHYSNLTIRPRILMSTKQTINSVFISDRVKLSITAQEDVTRTARLQKRGSVTSLELC